MAEVKPRSFRIDEETAEKFKKICLEAGLNQQDALAKLIESYELQAGKTVLTEKRDDIEVFERYTSLLVQKYMGALEEIQDSRETIRSEFKAQLDSKDALICDLQAQKKAAEEAKQQVTADAKKATDEADKLRKDLETEQKRCKELEADKEAFSGRNKDLEADRSRLEADRKLQTEIQALKEEKQQAIDKYQEKCAALLEKLQERKPEEVKKENV